MQKDGRLKFWKEYTYHNFSQIVFIDETRIGKAKQRKLKKKKEKHEISYNKHGKR